MELLFFVDIYGINMLLNILLIEQTILWCYFLLYITNNSLFLIKLEQILAGAN